MDSPVHENKILRNKKVVFNIDPNSNKDYDVEEQKKIYQAHKNNFKSGKELDELRKYTIELAKKGYTLKTIQDGKQLISYKDNQFSLQNININLEYQKFVVDDSSSDFSDINQSIIQPEQSNQRFVTNDTDLLFQQNQEEQIFREELEKQRQDQQNQKKIQEEWFANAKNFDQKLQSNKRPLIKTKKQKEQEEKELNSYDKDTWGKKIPKKQKTINNAKSSINKNSIFDTDNENDNDNEKDNENDNDNYNNYTNPQINDIQENKQNTFQQQKKQKRQKTLFSSTSEEEDQQKTNQIQQNQIPNQIQIQIQDQNQNKQEQNDKNKQNQQQNQNVEPQKFKNIKNYLFSDSDEPENHLNQVNDNKDQSPKQSKNTEIQQKKNNQELKQIKKQVRKSSKKQEKNQENQRSTQILHQNQNQDQDYNQDSYLSQILEQDQNQIINQNEKNEKNENKDKGKKSSKNKSSQKKKQPKQEQDIFSQYIQEYKLCKTRLQQKQANKKKTHISILDTKDLQLQSPSKKRKQNKENYNENFNESQSQNWDENFSQQLNSDDFNESEQKFGNQLNNNNIQSNSNFEYRADDVTETFNSVDTVKFQNNSIIPKDIGKLSNQQIKQIFQDLKNNQDYICTFGVNKFKILKISDTNKYTKQLEIFQEAQKIIMNDPNQKKLSSM
ncbi:hypothetical protein PPERSA_08427 [Pseudocohnilembus persalinus]|uniref:Uncharacterized protein n=1 Tax=Pseudocohnilembus persalinus TaxID=266149 RepID=A0A0V0R791_PSEPJ|nr:hypothetical protein PPERSA_08427 [Pseudocohnilembus persalinus]|eukprot:KRX10024.1 hypothetical protein PPERSA_08427 [Pseudocohnilembus persalinus]